MRIVVGVVVGVVAVVVVVEVPGSTVVVPERSPFITSSRIGPTMSPMAEALLLTYGTINHSASKVISPLAKELNPSSYNRP